MTDKLSERCAAEAEKLIDVERDALDACTCAVDVVEVEVELARSVKSLWRRC